MVVHALIGEVEVVEERQGPSKQYASCRISTPKAPNPLMAGDPLRLGDYFCFATVKRPQHGRYGSSPKGSCCLR